MRELTDMALIGEMVNWKGPTKAAKLFGWLMVAAGSGVSTRSQLVTVESWASQATRYRIWNEVHALRDHLSRLGYELTDDEVVAVAYQRASAR